MLRDFALSILLVGLLGGAGMAGDDAAALLKVIQSPETSDVDRANAFEKIGDVASDDAVEPLVGFLGDKKWSHYARFALQKMEGKNATAALLQSLDVLDGDLKLGVISTVGRRRDTTAVAPLAKLLASTDAEVSEAAAVALGWIGTPDATAVLTKAFGADKAADRRESLAGALLAAGQRLVKSGNSQAAIDVFDQVRSADLPKAYRIGATENAILARGADGVGLMVEQLKSSDVDYLRAGLSVSRVLPGESATEALSEALERESLPQRQVLLIQALQDRGDNRARDVVLDKIKSASQAVRLAAIDATGRLGDDSSLSTLLSVVDGATTDAVLAALVALQGANVNTGLMKAAESPDTSAIAVRALGKRRAKEAADLLYQLAADDASAASGDAIAALGMTVPHDRFSDLLGMLKTANDDTRKGAVRKAINAAIFRSSQPDVCAEALGAMIPNSSAADREFLFEQMRIAGGARAVALIREYATGSDVALQDSATKTLGLWLSADAAPVLLQVAQGRGRFANRALGGYIRIFRQFELSEKERVAMAANALKLAKRPNERNVAISAMTRFPCVGTFDLALGQLDVPGSEAAAAKAALTIGRTVLDLAPEKGMAGLKRLIDANVDQSVTNSAKALIE